MDLGSGITFDIILPMCSTGHLFFDFIKEIYMIIHVEIIKKNIHNDTLDKGYNVVRSEMKK